MNAFRLALTSVPVLFAVAVEVHTHHSWSPEYDLSQSRQIMGKVARFAYQSPHSSIVIDIETPEGKRERWTAEWGSPQRLRDRGVTAETIDVGDELLVTGNPHRDPKTRSLRVLSLLRLEDGLEL
jgi:hypothetical protein